MTPIAPAPSARTAGRRRPLAAGLIALLAAALVPAGIADPGLAELAPAAAPGSILFQNVRIFDGRKGVLSPLSHVLVVGNRIDRISAQPLAADAATRVIDGGGRVLMPGLIDTHWHTIFIRPTPAEMMAADPAYINFLAGAEATDTLMRGFTTVRDVGGPAFSRHENGHNGRRADDPRNTKIATADWLHRTIPIVIATLL